MSDFAGGRASWERADGVTRQDRAKNQPPSALFRSWNGAVGAEIRKTAVNGHFLPRKGVGQPWERPVYAQHHFFHTVDVFSIRCSSYFQTPTGKCTS
eukprot:1154174-Pelagomonas_calceolata.AAC.6